MKKLLSAIFAVVLGAGLGLLAQDHGQSNGDSARIAGEWQLALETPHGAMGGALQLKQDGAKLTGVCDVEHLGSMPLTGAMEGKKISFSIETHDGQKFTFAGTVEGGKMSGTTEPAGGTWTATRKQS